MATYNANGVDIDGITSKGGMIDAINTYKSALQKSLNTVSKTHANTTLMNNAMKGAGVEEAYNSEASTAVKNAFNIK